MTPLVAKPDITPLLRFAQDRRADEWSAATLHTASNVDRAGLVP